MLGILILETLGEKHLFVPSLTLVIKCKTSCTRVRHTYNPVISWENLCGVMKQLEQLWPLFSSSAQGSHGLVVRGAGCRVQNLSWILTSIQKILGSKAQLGAFPRFSFSVTGSFFFFAFLKFLYFYWLTPSISISTHYWDQTNSGFEILDSFAEVSLTEPHTCNKICCEVCTHTVLRIEILFFLHQINYGVLLMEE